MIATRQYARRTAMGIGLVVLAYATPHAVWAQPTQRDPIAAETLFERGKRLIEQGRTAEACAAFAESERLDPAGGTLLRLALCREADGKLASAWLAFTEVVRVSREGSTPGDPAKLAERVRIAREHLAAIEPRVPKLVIAVATDARADGLQVTANGLPRNEGSWGVAIPMDSGDVEIVASAPGHQPFRTTVHVEEGKEQRVEVPPLPALEAESPAQPAPEPLIAEPLATNRASFLRPAGIGVGAAGIVALGVGTYFGLNAISKWNDSNRTCPTTSCDPQSVSEAQDAKQAARIADVAVVAGLVAVAAGVVLYVMGAPKNVQATAGHVGLAF
jgi:hypothetical protein